MLYSALYLKPDPAFHAKLMSTNQMGSADTGRDLAPNQPMGNLCGSIQGKSPENATQEKPSGEIIIFPDDAPESPGNGANPSPVNGSHRAPDSHLRHLCVVLNGDDPIRPGEIQVDVPDLNGRNAGDHRNNDGRQIAEPALYNVDANPSPPAALSQVFADVPKGEIPYLVGFEDKAPIRWTKGELIGAGAYGRVFLGLNQVTGRLMAVKQVQTPDDESCRSRVAEHVKALEEEVRMLKQLKHPNIVQYLGTERNGDTLNIFLEYAAGGSVASLLSKFGAFQETLTRLFTKQILQGLEFLHQNGIAHRDIKGGNILVDHLGAVKLADFGASKRIEDLVTLNSGFKSLKGTPYWMAPEVIKQTGAQGHFF